MKNKFIPTTSKIKEFKLETPSMFTITLDKKIKAKPGQFFQLGLEGLGEAPISISKLSPMQFSIRKVGTITNTLAKLKKGDIITIRGPYGNGYPKIKKGLVIIAGGCGIAPLRPLLKRAKKVYLGFKSYKEIPFKDELLNKKNIKIALEEKKKGFTKGLLIDILTDIPEDSAIFICGPPIMIKFVLQKIKAPKKDIYISLERLMKCGFGICGHCQIGNGKFACKDGPVFNLGELPNYE